MFPLRDNIPSRRWPLATWALITFNALVFLFQLTLTDQQLQQIVYLYGVVPRRFTHPYWAHLAGFPGFSVWPFLTSQFLHGGWLHIIGNMWTLWIFGDNVEDRMGPVRFLLFYLGCGVAACLTHVIISPNSAVPAIGASGAIAGVLAAYLLLYPLARVVCLVPIFFYPLLLEVPAFLFVLVWIILQFFSGALALMTPEAGGGVAWWEHIGGFAFGFTSFRFFIPRKTPRRIF